MTSSLTCRPETRPSLTSSAWSWTRTWRKYFRSASLNPVCQGTTVTYTAVPFNGGTLLRSMESKRDKHGDQQFNLFLSPGGCRCCDMYPDIKCHLHYRQPGNLKSHNHDGKSIQTVSVSIASSVNPLVRESLWHSLRHLQMVVFPGLWMEVNGITAGANSPLYIYPPVNGDIITCKLTSNASCTAGNPATSNAVTMTVSQSQPLALPLLLQKIQFARAHRWPSLQLRQTGQYSCLSVESE